VEGEAIEHTATSNAKNALHQTFALSLSKPVLSVAEGHCTFFSDVREGKASTSSARTVMLFTV
jgi:hypothetical protein